MTARRLVPLSGIAAVALIVAAFAIPGETPDTDASVGQVASYYLSHDTDLQWASGLLALAALFFVFFSTNVAGLLRRAQGDAGGSSALSFAGGIMFAVGVLIFAGIGFTLGDAADHLGPASIQTLHVLNNDMFFPVAIGTATFLIGTGIAVVKTGALPKWLGWVAIVVGIVAVTPAGFFAFMVLGIWTVIVSVMLSLRAGTETEIA
jgi:hypothetical protein